MSRVFVLRKQPNMDYSAAAHFGELVSLMDGQKVNQYDPDQMSEFFVQTFEQYEFDPEKDYVLMAGTNIAIAQMFVFLLVNYGTIHCLNFNPLEVKYFETIYALEDYTYDPA